MPEVWDDPAHLLVLPAVVNELDNLKKSKDSTSAGARTTPRLRSAGIRHLARASPADPGRLLDAGHRWPARGQVTIEMIFDPAGHVRLPITDDETINQALALQPPGRSRSLTCDTAGPMNTAAVASTAAAGVAEAIQSADADTIRRRYLGGHPRVTPGLLDFLTTVDYVSRFALVAVEPASGRGVAIARYEPAEQDGTADVAIAVTPGWRGAGLATELLRMLAQAASERGIHTFTGTYFADNRPVTALIHTTDAPADRVTSGGIAEFSVALPPPDRES